MIPRSGRIAARHVFLSRGYAGATLEAVANEAGFSTGVVYSQFGSKADLLFALLERRIDERAEQNDRVAAEMPGAEGLRELMRVAGRDTVAEQGWARLLVEFRMLAARDPDLNARYAALHRQTRERLASVLSRLHDGAGLRPTLPLEALAEFILAVGVGTTVERAADPAALAAEDLLVMLPRALGLPDAALRAGRQRTIQLTAGRRSIPTCASSSSSTMTITRRDRADRGFASTPS